MLPAACVGEKPITYDREWRMHMPNPNLLHVSVGSGPDTIPRSLVDLVSDCGSYSPDQRPSMREVSATQHTTKQIGADGVWSSASISVGNATLDVSEHVYV
jgi:hypothetical protein